MDDLQAAVAAYLRAQRRPPRRAPRAFTCRGCGRMVREDAPDPAIPFAALWVPLRCQACFAGAIARDPEETILGLWRDRCGALQHAGRSSADSEG